MKCLKSIKAMVIGLFLISICPAENYTVSLFFETTESSLNTLFRAQVFPHPVGTHIDETYEITLWNPQITIELGEVVFSFTISGYVSIGGTTTQYDFPFSLPLTIPTGELSVSGIIAFLEGIPDQISNMDGPQWLKDIIIGEYEGLELWIYPKSLLEDANESIPEFVDVQVNDVSFTWEAVTNLLRFSLNVDVTANSPLIRGQWQETTGAYLFRFNSNIEVEILYIGVYNNMGSTGEEENPAFTIRPGGWTNSIYVDFEGDNVPSGNYRCKVLYGSTYGWFAVYYSFNNLGTSGWNAMSITSSI